MTEPDVLSREWSDRAVFSWAALPAENRPSLPEFVRSIQVQTLLAAAKDIETDAAERDALIYTGWLRELAEGLKP